MHFKLVLVKQRVLLELELPIILVGIEQVIITFYLLAHVILHLQDQYQLMLSFGKDLMVRDYS